MYSVCGKESFAGAASAMPPITIVQLVAKVASISTFLRREDNKKIKDTTG